MRGLCYIYGYIIIQVVISLPLVIFNYLPCFVVLTAVIIIYIQSISLISFRTLREKVSNIPLEVLRQIAYGENIHIHDPLRLKENASTVLNILLQIYEAVLNNSLALEKVPIREIVNTVNEQIAKSRLEDIVRETVVEYWIPFPRIP